MTYKYESNASWESVREFICGLGRLDFRHIYAFACLKLWKALSIGKNVVVNVVHEAALYTVEFTHLCSLFCVSLENSSFCALKTAVVEHFKLLNS